MVEPVPAGGGGTEGFGIPGDRGCCWAVGGMSWELEQAPARQETGAASAGGGGDFTGPLGVWFPFKYRSPGQGFCCLQKAQQNESSKVWTLPPAPLMGRAVIWAGHC